MSNTKKYLFNNEWLDLSTLLNKIHKSGKTFSKPTLSLIHDITSGDRVENGFEIAHKVDNVDNFTEDMYKIGTDGEWKNLSELRASGYDISTNRTINKLDDYLYEITFNDYDIADAVEMLEYSMPNGAACSSLQFDISGLCSVRGRNFDWFYDHEATFVVKTTHKNNRYATLGVAGGIPSATKQSVENAIETGIYPDKIFSPMPYFTVDGINECGICINTNVVPVNEYVKEFDEQHGEEMFPNGRYNSDNNKYPFTIKSIPRTLHTNTNAEHSYSMIMIPRLILDNCSNFDECVALLKSNDFYGYYPSDPTKAAEEFHFMLTVPNIGTMYIEFVNGDSIALIMEEVTVILKDGEVINPGEVTGYNVGWNSIFENDVPIMTNYNMYYRVFNGVYTQHAMGIERENILQNCINVLVGSEEPPDEVLQNLFGDDLEDLKTAISSMDINKLTFYTMRAANYTKAYTSNDKWLSEFHAVYNLDEEQLDLTVDSDENSFNPILEIVDNLYENKSRDTSKTWQTVHTSIYDLINHTLMIANQENKTTYTFTL